VLLVLLASLVLWVVGCRLLALLLALFDISNVAVVVVVVVAVVASRWLASATES